MNYVIFFIADNTASICKYTICYRKKCKTA